MGVERVEPKMGSYTTEWTAVRFDPLDVAAAKKLFRLSPWAVQMDLSAGEGVGALVCTQMIGGQKEEWTVLAGSWIVKSPHGRFWFMDEEEFRSQFMVGW